MLLELVKCQNDGAQTTQQLSQANKGVELVTLLFDPTKHLGHQTTSPNRGSIAANRAASRSERLEYGALTT